MIKIYEDIKTVIVVGDESHNSIYNYCNEWLTIDGISYVQFIDIIEHDNLIISDDWKIFFRKELKTDNIKTCLKCFYSVSMNGTSVKDKLIYCNYERTHIPLISGIKCDYFK